MIIYLISAQVLVGQGNQMLQVKTFDTQLKSIGDLNLIFNGSKQVAIGPTGTAFAEFTDTELPIKSITVDNREVLEVGSWNLSKGVLEITIRKKSHKDLKLVLVDDTGDAVEGAQVNYKGNTAQGMSNAQGITILAVGFDDQAPAKEDIKIDGYTINQLTDNGDQVKLVLNPIRSQTQPQAPRAAVNASDPVVDDQYFKDFDLSRVDSIQSLTAFYAIFKNFQIEDLNEEMQRKIDAKFNELIGKLQDSASNNGSVSFIRNISDTTLLQEDIGQLLKQAQQEGTMLDEQHNDFVRKIDAINGKLEKGATSLTEAEKEELLRDLQLLERTLAENEDRFYKNQNSYQQIINNLAEKYFDLEDLEGKLYESEAQRLEEQRIFKERLFAILIALGVFAIMTVLLIYFSDKLKSQKKELEKVNGEINTINENLEHIVYERTQLLEETNRELDTVLYRASHDLRSPIRSIIGLCNIAAMNADSDSDELFKQMEVTTSNMDRLLKKLSMISEVNQPGPPRDVDVCSVLSQVKSQFDPLILESNINFQLECEQDLKIKSIPNLIDVILSNLIENAIFYCQLKGDPDSEIVLSAASTDDSMELIVYDSGVGVDDAISDKLFEMFYRGHEYSKGNGLGLYIVHKCVHILGGQISLESEEGKYTKFVVSLPLVYSDKVLVS